MLESELDRHGDARCAPAFGAAEYDMHFATNRPEDVEVDPKTGDVYVALHEQLDRARRARRGAPDREDGNDPEASTFTWEDFANGGPTGRQRPGRAGLLLRRQPRVRQRNDLWVVTDISSSTLNRPGPLAVPRQQRDVLRADRRGPGRPASRSASRTCRSRRRAPGRTSRPTSDTLFVNVQHPGEVTNDRTRRASSAHVGDVHVLLAGRQQDGEPQPVDPEAVDRRDHAARSASPTG